MSKAMEVYSRPAQEGLAQDEAGFSASAREEMRELEAEWVGFSDRLGSLCFRCAALPPGMQTHLSIQPDRRRPAHGYRTLSTVRLGYWPGAVDVA